MAKLIKIRSRKYPNNPEINWDFESIDDDYQAKLDSILGREDLEQERVIIDGVEPYSEDDVLERIPATDDEPAKVRLRAQYIVEVEDITAELQEREEKQAAREAAREDLKQVKKLVQDAKQANNEQQLKKVVQDLAKAVLQISKALGLADPKDEESLV